MGLTQLHLPEVGRRDFYDVQHIRGSIDLTYGAAEFKSLQERVHVAPDGSSSFTTRCPAGNTFRCLAVDDAAAEVRRRATEALGALPGAASRGLGITAVTVDCPPGSCAAICRFYQELCGASASCEAGVASVECGPVSLRFAEAPDFKELRGWSRDVGGDQWHIALYVHDFEGMFERLLQRGLQWDNPRIKDYARTLAEARQRQQFRFKDIVDLSSGEVLLELEHEVRSFQHPSCPLKRTKEQADAAVSAGRDHLGRMRL